jgi:hypothetical protein
VRPPSLRSSVDSTSRLSGTTLISAGLITLIALTFWPRAPIVSTVAIITLGATEVTLARFRGTAILIPVAMLHGTTYAGIYAILVGAALHSASASSAAAIGIWTALDLAASVLPMTVALQHIFICLRQSTMPRP